jgi:protoporphyrinogen/coproporphyrinogen III oxidase
VNSTSRIVIIGAGISGLATAFFLSKADLRPVLIEKSNRLGGLIKTDFIEGCCLEAGPDSYIATKTSVTELARELDGLDSEIIGSNDSARRIFIVRGGKLIPMPKGMVMMAPAEWKPALTSQLFSAQTKLRFLRETLQSPKTRQDDISLGQFVKEHFGREVVEYVAAPLLSGVYGGDAESLSTESVLPRFLSYERQYGSLIRGVRRERRAANAKGSLFLSFRKGMQTLTDTLADATASSTQVIHAEVSKVESSGSGWRVYAGQDTISCDQVVLACPTHQAARLLESCASSLAAELAGIPYSSVILATLVYQRANLNHALDGFGFLVPRSERRGVAAATWVGTKWPHRLPPTLAALRAFIVGEDAIRFAAASEPELLGLVQGEYRRLMGITAQPVFSTVYRWPHSMPQYVLGHKQRCRRIWSELAERPGLHLVNNAFDGVGVPDCVRLAKQTAKAIVNKISLPLA